MSLALILVVATAGCNQGFQSSRSASGFASNAAGAAAEPDLLGGQQVAQPTFGRVPGPFKIASLADQIDRYYRGTNPGPVGVTTFVNLDDLYSTSTFGRMYSEELMGELTVRGYDVVELRHSDALQFLGSSGEFGLSRDTAMVRRMRDLGALVVGTYVVSPIKVYVNARLLNPSTSAVLSAGSIELPKNGELARLLRGGGMPGTLERIPVRHLGFDTYPLNRQNQQGRQWDLEEGGSELAGGLGAEPRIPIVRGAPPKRWSKPQPKARKEPVIEGLPLAPPPPSPSEGTSPAVEPKEH